MNLEKPALKRTGSAAFSNIQIAASASYWASWTGKEVPAYLIRHHPGTVLSERFGIGKTASEIGHSSIGSRTTASYLTPSISRASKSDSVTRRASLRIEQQVEQSAIS